MVVVSIRFRSGLKTGPARPSGLITGPASPKNLTNQEGAVSCRLVQHCIEGTAGIYYVTVAARHVAHQQLTKPRGRPSYDVVASERQDLLRDRNVNLVAYLKIKML